MYLTDMYVPPKARRRGIARTLLCAARDQLIARGGTHMSGDLSTRPAVDAVRAALGHDAVHSVLEGEYVPGEPDYVPPAIGRIDYNVPDTMTIELDAEHIVQHVVQGAQ